MESHVVLSAMLAGVFLSLLLGPLGCFVVWRRLAYFGDAIAHASLLGVALALIFSLPVTPLMFLVAMCIAIVLSVWMRDVRYNADTMLGFLAHGALATGLLLVSLSNHNQIDINSFLFGDILTINVQDFLVILTLVAVGLLLLFTHWNALVLATLHKELAKVEGVAMERLNYLLITLLALTVAVCIKLVGVLLITALLIMPAAAARPFAKSPKHMAILSVICSAGAIITGLVVALTLDSPTGPTIVVASALLCLLNMGLSRLMLK